MDNSGVDVDGGGGCACIGGGKGANFLLGFAMNLSLL